MPTNDSIDFSNTILEVKVEIASMKKDLEQLGQNMSEILSAIRGNGNSISTRLALLEQKQSSDSGNLIKFEAKLEEKEKEEAGNRRKMLYSLLGAGVSIALWFGNLFLHFSK
jgi:hypothetical protein